jgi:uncharacterized protein (DUF2236 family)
MPPVPLSLRPAVRAVALAGIALLPNDVRELYGLRVSATQGAVIAAGRTSLRRLSLARALPRVWSAQGHGLPLRLLAALG